MSEVPENLFPSAVKWGTDAGDLRFVYVCRYLQRFQTVINHLADVELLCRDMGKGKAKGKRTTCGVNKMLEPSPENCLAIKTLRMAMLDFSEHVDSEPFPADAQLPKVGNSGFVHCSLLDNMVKWKDVAQALRRSADSRVATIQSDWDTFAQTSMDDITSNLPPYQLVKETLLDHLPVMQSMIANTKGSSVSK